LNLTMVPLVKLLPDKVTAVPTPPLEGAKLEMAGAETKEKLDALLAVPPGRVTLIAPVLAPAGTVAVIAVELTAEKLVASTPLNLTAVTP